MDGPRNSARYEQQIHNAESREAGLDKGLGFPLADL